LGTSLKERITYNEFLTTLTDILDYQFEKFYVNVDNSEQLDNNIYEHLKSKYLNNLVHSTIPNQSIQDDIIINNEIIDNKYSSNYK